METKIDNAPRWWSEMPQNKRLKVQVGESDAERSAATRLIMANPLLNKRTHIVLRNGSIITGRTHSVRHTLFSKEPSIRLDVDEQCFNLPVPIKHVSVAYFELN